VKSSSFERKTHPAPPPLDFFSAGHAKLHERDSVGKQLRKANIESVQNCTDSLASPCQHSGMVETSFYRLKAERCAQMAKDEVDSGRRAELESESSLWLQIAVTEDDLDGLRKKAQNLLNAQAIQKAGRSRSR
jgi:hypothetical protein